jgi:hypothetical protein
MGATSPTSLDIREAIKLLEESIEYSARAAARCHDVNDMVNRIFEPTTERWEEMMWLLGLARYAQKEAGWAESEADRACNEILLLAGEVEPTKIRVAADAS